MADPQSVSQFENLLQPYTTVQVQMGFYSLEVKSTVHGVAGLYLVDFRLSGETAISFHFDVARSTFRVVDVGPREVSDFCALSEVFDRAKAFVRAARGAGFREGEVRHS